MPEETPKNKLYEFRCFSQVTATQVIAIVAVNLQTAVATMLKHGYQVGGADFWLERIYDKVFDQIIVTAESAELSPEDAGLSSRIEKNIIERLEEYQIENLKKELQAQTLKQFADFLAGAKNKTLKCHPGLLMFVSHLKTKSANCFPVTLEQVLALPQYKELDSFCQNNGYRLEVDLRNEPLINEGLDFQILYVGVKRKTLID
ncbi:MAG: hypothetical protein WC668_04020 [Patescibacteria group bacterium]|jgi:hypothetical protein